MLAIRGGHLFRRLLLRVIAVSASDNCRVFLILPREKIQSCARGEGRKRRGEREHQNRQKPKTSERTHPLPFFPPSGVTLTTTATPVRTFAV